MVKWILLVLLAIPLCGQIAIKEVFKADFTKGLDGWTVQGAGVESGENGLHCTLDSHGTAMITKNVDIKDVVGKRVLVQAEFKIVKDIVKPPERDWQGGKAQLHFVAGNNHNYPNAFLRGQHPGFAKYVKAGDWMMAERVVNMPEDTKLLELMVGLQDCTGELYIRYIKLSACDHPTVFDYKPYAAPVPTATTRRGVMTGNGNTLEAKDLEDLASWNANLIRFQIKVDNLTICPHRPVVEAQKGKSRRDAYLSALDWWMDHLGRVLVECEKHGIKVVVDLHRGPAQTGNSNHLMETGEHDDILFEAWKRIATRFRGHPQIYGYDILNEPIEEYSAIDVMNGASWNNLVERLVRHIRQFDAETPIIVESLDCASIMRFKDLRPVQDPHIIYSPHFYSPGLFTHQGIGNNPRGAVYPGKIDGKEWNRAAIRASMQQVVDFQKKYNVPIYVGEFSAAVWAKGAAQYLDDCMSVFEELGWDYTYHAFREAPCWDLERDAEMKPSPVETDRKMVVLKYFKKNIRNQ